jgi:hypothetical protein
MRNAHVGAGHALFLFIQNYVEVPAAHEIALCVNLEETARAYLLFIYFPSASRCACAALANRHT